MEEVYISSSSQDTQEIAKKIASKLNSGTTICLWGNMAAGKTTFTQGVGEFFNINRLTSPTFIIMREYEIESHPTIKKLYHLDLYRLESSDEIKAFDIEEIIADPANLVVIEWPEKLNDMIPKNRLDIYLKSTDDNEREIKIIKH